MAEKKKTVHPYIPNSAPATKAKMLEEIGIKDIDELYADIPEELRFNREMDLPGALPSELELKRHVARILSKNKTCEENISFLGAGCGQHYVPAICDEITQRSEFLTAYAGEPYEDHGRFQALFEYQSLMAELLDMDVVNVPTYDWTQAASTSVRMAGRITGRSEVLVADTMSPDRLMVMKNYCEPVMTVKMIGHNSDSGLLDLEDLKAKIGTGTAAVYFENPSYLGFIEAQGEEITRIAHENGALAVVGVDPISLGVLAPPSHYGGDIICGDIQGLGNHMYYGGSLAGFISTRDEETFVMEYPSRLFGITRTAEEGEWGFGDVAYDRTSFGVREKGKEFIGTASALYGIGAAVYLSLMGPKGMKELGIHILQKSQYAMKKISLLKGVSLRFTSSCFKEFVVDFSGTGQTAAAINKKLLDRGIFGGKDLTGESQGLDNCALYCVTEVNSMGDIDTLVRALEEVIHEN